MSSKRTISIISIVVGFAAISTGILIPKKSFAFEDTGFTNYYGGSEYLNNYVRGLRNNNPGNIKLTKIPWKGKIPNELNTDGTFEQFISYEYGVRALIVNIKTYYNKYGLNTVEKIITKYAPNNENKTNKYIADVRKILGLAKNQKFVLNKTTISALIMAIDRIENGRATITKEHLDKAFKLL